ncbi:mitochondrial carrier domain-containing protein [Dichotomocladium elegans]|nr:mitochondrial carrier domain-containing protein [Dichotomocladium elegans]
MQEEYDYESLGSNSSMTQNAVAGAFAGIAEHCAMYPVDSIKTRMQVIQSGRPPLAAIAATPSFKSASLNLWRGVNSVVMGAGPAHALHFATYEYLKEVLSVDGNGNNTPSILVAGAFATLAHDALMTPFDVVKQRMQLRDSTYKSVRECARTVFAKEGLSAFYISLPTTLAMSIPFQSIQFATYEYFRHQLNPRGEYDPKTHVIAGALAGAIASSITTPLDVAKTLLQTRGQSHDPRIRNVTGLWDAMAIIRQRYGLRGFYRGYKPRVLTNMPSAAISWSVYEYFKWFFDKSTFATGQHGKNLLGL